MTWLRLDDGFATDPVILNICRTRGEKTRVLGWITELMLYCAKHLTDGYLPEVIFRDVVRSPRWRETLTNPPSGVALVHRRGDWCTCMVGRTSAWPATAADYYMHHYLASNPSREETDVARAKQAELRDRELQAAVRRRDVGLCRYCGIAVVWADRRSGAGGVFDHVDPGVAAGAANLVVACRGCNSRKGQRTPAAAGMTLLPVPTPATRTGGNQQQTNRSASEPTTHPPVRDGTGRASESGAGDAGPDGHRPATGPARTGRTSIHPDPYRRSAITGPDPRDHAGLPSPADIAAAALETEPESEADP